MNDNVVNPELIEQLTGNDYEKNWKKYFGVDFVSRGEDLGEVVLDCFKAQKSDFAKNCRNNKGLFKCCASGSSFETFQHLRKAGNLSTRICPEQMFNAKKANEDGFILYKSAMSKLWKKNKKRKEGKKKSKRRKTKKKKRKNKKKRKKDENKKKRKKKVKCSTKHKK